MGALERLGIPGYAVFPIDDPAYVFGERHADLEARRDDAEYRRGMVALRLAKDLATYQALMRGERVHVSRLDQEALARLRAEGLA